MELTKEECKLCKQEVAWGTTKKGKRMPVDTEPTSEGKYMLEGSGSDVLILKAPHKYNGPRFDCHFDTCTER